MKTQDDIKYSARIEHSEESIKLLTEMQYNTFAYGRKVGQVIASVALLIMGAFGGKHPLGIISLALGSFLIVSINYRPKTTAKQICNAYKGVFPKVEYTFTDTGVRTQTTDAETKYKDFIRLMEDANYLYLYVNQATAFMVDKKSIEGEKQADGFMKFMAQKTGMEWKKPFSLLRGGSPIWEIIKKKR